MNHLSPEARFSRPRATYTRYPFDALQVGEHFTATPDDGEHETLIKLRRAVGVAVARRRAKNKAERHVIRTMREDGCYFVVCWRTR